MNRRLTSIFSFSLVTMALYLPIATALLLLYRFVLPLNASLYNPFYFEPAFAALLIGLALGLASLSTFSFARRHPLKPSFFRPTKLIFSLTAALLFCLFICDHVFIGIASSPGSYYCPLGYQARALLDSTSSGPLNDVRAPQSIHYPYATPTPSSFPDDPASLAVDTVRLVSFPCDARLAQLVINLTLLTADLSASYVFASLIARRSVTPSASAEEQP